MSATGLKPFVASRDQCDIILQGMADGLVVLDATGRLLYANEAAARLLGYASAQALLEKPFEAIVEQLSIQDEFGDPLAMRHLPGPRALRGKTAPAMLLRYFVDASDEERWVVMSAAPIRDPDQRVQFVMLILHDVTQQKQSERRLSAQYSIARILAEATTLAEAAPKILQAIGENLNWEVGLLWTPDAEAQVLRCTAYWQLPHSAHPQFEQASFAFTFTRGIGLPGRIWASGQPAWIRDVREDDNFARARHAVREGLHAALGFPIIIDHEVRGVFEFFSRAIRQPDHDLLALMLTIGVQIGQFMDRKQREAALRDAELKYRTLVEQIPAITYIAALGETGGLLYVSPQHERILGFSRDEWINDANLRRSHIHPDDRERVLREHERSLATGEPFRCEYRLFARDGRELWMYDEAVIVRDEQGQPRFRQGIVFDITSRKRVEQELRALAEARDRALAETGLLNDIAIAASGEQNLNRMLSAALTRLREVIHFTGGSIALVEKDDLVIRAAFGVFTGIALGNRLRRNHGRSWQVIHTREPVLIDDVTLEKNATPTTPFRTWLGVPLIWQGEVYGLLEIDSTEAHAFSAADVSLMQKVATVLSGSIELAQRYAAEVQAVELAEAAQWRLETVLQQMPSGVAIAEYPSSRLVRGNEQLSRIMGQPFRPIESIEGYGATTAFRADGSAVRAEDWPLARSILTGEVVRGEEITFVRADGTHGTMRINSAPIRDRRGNTIAAVAVFDDVSERKQVENALYEINSILKAVFEGTTDAVFVKDLAGRYLLMNKAGAQMLGRVPDEVIGKADDELFAPESVVRIRQRDAEVIRTGKTITYEETATAAGVTRIYLSTKGPYRDPAGNIIGLIGVSRDITERKHAEEVNAQLYESERAARTEAELAQQRLAFLAEASRILASSLDYETTLQSVVSLAMSALADWCVVDVIQPDGMVQRIGATKGAGDVPEYLQTLARSYPLNPAAREGVQRVLATGEPLLAREITAEQLSVAARDPEHLAILQQLGLRSGIIVPIQIRAEMIGALSIYSSRSQRLYGPADLELAQELARRVATAIDNARLYRAAQEANARLEQRVIERTAELEATNKNLQDEIAERKAIEDELRHSREQLRQLATHLQSAREEERNRIAREIHDQLGQVLTAVKMDLSLLGRKFSDGQQSFSRSAVLQELKSMSQLLDNTIKSVREIITELRPEMLEDLGLKAAMEWQAQEFEARTQIKTHFSSNLMDVDLDLERSTAVFRILQEALTNIARHANATQVHIELRAEPTQLVLKVQDNGKGITASEMVKAHSFGILGMRERALLFGGTVEISGQPRQGTTLTVQIPYPVTIGVMASPSVQLNER